MSENESSLILAQARRANNRLISLLICRLRRKVVVRAFC